MWKIFVEPDRPRMTTKTKQETSDFLWGISKARVQTHIQNMQCLFFFPTATMFTPTPPSVVLYIHFLSC
jgi:hypothetical protein